MTHDSQDEDRTILAALDRGIDPDAGDLAPRGADSETGETLARLYTETLGLIPYALAPVAPAPALRERLMAVVMGDETQEVERSELAPLPPAPAPRISPPPAARPAGPSSPLMARRSARRWPLALAAGLVLGLVGLSAWLYQGLVEQNRALATSLAKIERLERAQAGSQRTAARTDLDRRRASLADLEKTLSLVTAPTVEMSALRPTGKVALARQAQGRIYIAQDHQHWYLAVQDLEPAGTGRRYELWFLGDQGPVSGGTFTGARGESAELGSEHMPAGIKAIVITLEPASGAPAPSGPEVLRAMPPVKVL